MKKVIVTGINGLIGQYIYKPLEELGFEVFGIGTKYIERSNYFSINLNDHIKLENIFKEIKPEYLIHLAWDTRKGYLDSDTNFDLLYSDIKMLKFFKENGGKKSVFIGTCFEYKSKDTPLKENDELNPITIYAKTKNYLREISELYSIKNDIDFCWCRVFYTYGYNENPNRLFPYIINSLKEDKKVYINYSQLKKDYIFAGDIAKAISLIIDSNFNGVINLCSGKTLSIGDIASLIANKMSKSYLLDLNEFNTSEAPIIVGNNSILRKNFGFEFTNIYDIIDDLISSYNKSYVINLYIKILKIIYLNKKLKYYFRF
ncbi:NAD(P)-dependent oxidoreductase [Brachyspira hyodysenteriae]|uniref:NAD-dependent epimerase/dehydratase family protein n=1 Tax=Brachyspira hyodysenteriae TaxID=159 RepID=UPI0022CE1108|nr:NAD(P)-dependent oxidoreductase [Brachyspira hyodysenteriae]MDA0027780.1 NAD(P)-dependent oxidoreductase [Brachyspira hyodysenteriae]